jgi:hypothetical protein
MIMKSEGLTDADIRALGWQALVAKLGVAGALRFTMQTESGYGDYSEWRHRMFGQLSVDEILAQLQTTSFRRTACRRRMKP